VEPIPSTNFGRSAADLFRRQVTENLDHRGGQHAILIALDAVEENRRGALAGKFGDLREQGVIGPAELRVADDRLVQLGVFLGESRVQLAHTQRPIAVAVELPLDGFAIEIEQRCRDRVSCLCRAFAGQACKNGEVMDVVDRTACCLEAVQDSFKKLLIGITQHRKRPCDLGIQWDVQRRE